ncbi:hypothetical protein [Pseudoalteromonas sp. MMG022]|uniref:hypothetical protein n=1 Tax=Pseudoalteromonas sp. MMG022 TaxID=2909978 RepID=UPI001F1FAF58|nr:hypothetical protein [Pseudoalteromonas sp. MMG022]MCF6437011.1 hypothetical protein [Pseudoalteromonas sp. MMG022]
MQQPSKADLERQAKLDAMGQKLSADTARKIDGQLATDLNNSLNTTMQGIDASVDRMLWASSGNQQIDVNAQFAAHEARRASRQQGGGDRANSLSASLSSQASALESRHRNQNAGIQAIADAAFAKGVVRGEAMYAAGVRNREQIGVDLLAGVDVEGNIAWGQQQRSKFNAIRSKASDIVFGPTGAPNAIETELNITGNIPMFEGGFGLSVTVDSFGRFTFTGGATATLTSDISANVSAALGQVKGYGADSFALGTGEAVSTTADVSIVDVFVDKNSKLGTFLKARPVDIFGGYESGYTQKGTYWDLGNNPSVTPAENLYHFKGGYVGGSVGWKDLYEFNASPLYKALGLEKLAIGKTYEYAASGYTTQPNLIGRVTYNLLDIFHD